MNFVGNRYRKGIGYDGEFYITDIGEGTRQI